MSVESFGTDRDDIRDQKFKKLKLKAGEEIRCGVVFFDEVGKKMFLGAKVHTGKDVKTFLCKSTKDKKEICCTHSWSGNNPRMHIGCAIVIYNIDQGKLRDFEIIPWLFWERMYNMLASADKEFPLTAHDIKIKCENEEYQTYSLTSCKESLWTKNPGLKTKVLEQAQPVYDKIAKNLGAELSVTEVKEILGIEVTGAENAATDVDLGSVVDSLE